MQNMQGTNLRSPNTHTRKLYLYQPAKPKTKHNANTPYLHFQVNVPQSSIT